MDTDDLVQETLLRSLRHLDPFDARRSGAFQAYLRRAVLNRIRDEIRRQQCRPAAEGGISSVLDARPSPLEEAIGRQALERYERALEHLRPEEKEAILARVELGFSYAQVAVALEKPSPDAARMAVARALARLAQEMSRGSG
jgi:RNA polymerase sigma-70 factor (ECF subfamily)